jgi:Xaa-Pro aminopeptidase
VKERIHRLISSYGELGIDALLVTKPQNVRYLTGFTGSAGICLVRQDGSGVFVTDPRYDVQAADEVEGFEVVVTRDSALKEVGRRALNEGIGSLGIEGAHMTVLSGNQLAEIAPNVSLVATDRAIENVRSVKEGSEIDLIRRAAAIADSALAAVLPIIKAGVAELDIAIELEYQMKKLGAEKAGFDTIVASGPRAAMAHGAAGKRRLGSGDPVVLDFGCFYRGYTSDMTRTVFVGAPSPEMKRVYEVVLKAQVTACETLKAGMTGKEADAVARSIIEEAGYGDRFGHGLGHGVGLEVHELPLVSPRNELPLHSSSVVSIEPGIYLPGVGGVRIEDLVVIRPEGIENLTSSSKELTCL